MFTDDDEDFLGGYDDDRGGAAAWVDPTGDAHHVAWHRDLEVWITENTVIRGYDAYDHGYLRLWTTFRNGNRELGFVTHTNPTPEQRSFVQQACETFDVTTLIAADRRIGREWSHKGADVAAHLPNLWATLTDPAL